MTLLVVPAAALAALGLALVASASPSGHPEAPAMGAPHHFAVREAIALATGALLAMAVGAWGRGRCSERRRACFCWRWPSPWRCFSLAWAFERRAPAAGCTPGRSPVNPAPFLIGAMGLLVASSRGTGRRGLLTRPTAVVALALLPIVVLVAEPDFSSAATALAVAIAALAGGGVASRRLAPAALIMLVALAIRRVEVRLRRGAGTRISGPRTGPAR